ncbi:MAG: TonB-dependent receptor [Myxococcota bacterium]|nr:TonB-dependent receptor [Myxococcota bacterium]
MSIRIRARASVARLVVLLSVALVVAVLPASGQEAPPASGDSGIVRGQIFDRDSGEPVTGVRVILIGPKLEGQPARRQQGVVSGDEGEFEFSAAAAGNYDVSFTKDGYRASTMTNFEVAAGTVNRADFPLPPLAQGGSEILELEAFVVEASTVEEQALGLDFRLEADEQVNTFSAKDFSKFSAGDVAEALERVVGVTIQEGQFAVIRGLEDRYNSTTYNGAPVPSPDPDRQSVQLDLFPSEVVSNLVVAKTFAPDLASNSSGGAIDIVTHDYPEEIVFSLKAGTGINTNAEDRFLRFDGDTNPDKIFEGVGPHADLDFLRKEFGFRFIDGNPVGKEDDKTGDWYDDLADILESDYVATFAGRKKFADREFRWKFVGAKEIDYDTAFGFQEDLEPRPARVEPGGQVRIDENFPACIFDPALPCFAQTADQLLSSGDLALGELNLSDGLFEFTSSRRTERLTAYTGLGMDLDPEGFHRIDASMFFTDVQEETIELFENGFLPGLDYRSFFIEQLTGAVDTETPENNPGFDVATLGSPILNRLRSQATGAPFSDAGTVAAASFFESLSFRRDRELKIYQINGDHDFDYGIPGLHFSWATNWARTTQDEVGLGLFYFYEPCGFAQQDIFACPEGVHRVTPDQIFPEAGPISRAPTIAELGPGTFIDGGDQLISSNLISERSRFTRFDLDWEFEFSQWSVFTAYAGVWHERADREVESAFLQAVDRDITRDEPNCFGTISDGFCISPENTPLDLGVTAFDGLAVGADGRLANLALTENESTRKIDAYYLKGKLELWEQLDLLGGFRFEDIFIESLNDPFGEGGQLGGPLLFPSRYLFFDRLDNPRERILFNGAPTNETSDFPIPGTVFNDQLLGIPVPVGECLGGALPAGVTEPDEGAVCVDFFDRESLESLLNGVIDEDKILPSAAFTFRPIEGLTLRGAYSETIARPSFRELGYYVSVAPGTNDLTVGNPLLQLSEVQSYDLRLEYVWGEGDLIAASGFYKDIEKPIESIILRDPSDFSLSAASQFRTFFNNPNDASLWGIEVEARKNLGFLGDWSWLTDLGVPGGFDRFRIPLVEYISVGGNFTYIDAEVKRTQGEIDRASRFFATCAASDPLCARSGDGALSTGLSDKRRLFGQPEWIANADISFDHEGWGTKATLAFFAISDVLDAAGGPTFIQPNGIVRDISIDRYVDSFHTLDLVLSQEWDPEWLNGSLSFKFRIKNLTDSTRRIIYDPDVTVGTVAERSVKNGRDYKFTLTYSF